MGKTGMSGSWSLNPRQVSDEFTKIDKGNNRIKMITNVFLPGGWGISVCCTISSSDSA